MKIMPAVFFLAFSVSSFAQQITSFTVSPPTPNDTDTVYIYVETTHPSGGCYGTAYSSLAGNTVTASALHCLGMLTVICTDYDTIKLNPLPAGTYNVDFTLSAGSGSYPCSPGIVPSDHDNTSFVVLSTMGIGNSDFSAMKIFPNPANNICNVQLSNACIPESYVRITDGLGRIIQEEKSNNRNSISIDVSGLTPGLYFMQLINPDGTIASVMKWVKQ